MGMVDRGCELDWISQVRVHSTRPHVHAHLQCMPPHVNAIGRHVCWLCPHECCAFACAHTNVVHIYCWQYPHERECLFAPLTGFELQNTRVEGGVLVAEVRLSVNLNALTIEQVVAKMKRAHLELVQLVQDGFTHAGVEAAALAPLATLKRTSAAREGEWFNVADNFKRANALAFDARDAVFASLRKREGTWGGAMSAATMCAREGRHDVAIELLKRALAGEDATLADGEQRDWKVQLAQWMVEHELAPPWPATFVALGDPALATLVAPLVEHDRLCIGKRVLGAEERASRWSEATVTRIEKDVELAQLGPGNTVRYVIGDKVDIQLGGWYDVKDVPSSRALVVAAGGAGAVLRAAAKGGDTALVKALRAVGVSALVADNQANTPLHLAAAQGHVEVCRALLAAGADSRIPNARGWRAEDLARSSSHIDVIRLFIPTLSDKEVAKSGGEDAWRAAAGGDVAALLTTYDKSNGPITALMVACRMRQLEAAKACLDTGLRARLGLSAADINAQSPSGCCALSFAAEVGDEGIVELLLAAQANVDLADEDGDTCLHKASENGHVSCVGLLLAAGAAVDQGNCHGNTPLMISSENGFVVCVTKLLAAGASPNQFDKGGTSTLHLACQKGHATIVAELLAAGAEVDHADDHGRTALMDASNTGSLTCLKEMLEAGAAVNTAQSDGTTALMHASLRGHAVCVEALLNAGAMPDLHTPVDNDEHGTTALMMASANGHVLCVEALLKAGAKPDEGMQAGDIGLNALMIASSCGHALCVEALLKAGANPDAAASDGYTALIYASINGQVSCLEILLNVCTEIDAAIVNDGMTALMKARKNEHAVCVEMLLSAGAKDCK